MKLVARIVAVSSLAWFGGSSAFSATPPPPVAPDGVTVTEAAFLDSLGVNVHVKYNDGAYANLGKVVEDLNYIGFSHVRTAAGGGVVPIESYIRMAQDGVRFNLLARNLPTDVTINFAAEMAQREPGSVVSIEGFNEINNWPVTFNGETSENAAKAAQAELYAKVKAHPSLARLPVFYFTGGTATSDISRMADFATIHAYNNNATQPGSWIGRELRQFSGSAATLPRTNTEFGNFTLPRQWPEGKPYWAGATALGVDEDTQARIVLNGFLEGVAWGFRRSYVYELLDQKPDPQMKQPQFHFGLFTSAHEPKAAATALRNLTGFLRQTGSGPSLGTVQARVDETSDDLGWVRIRRKDGSLILAVWNREPMWTWNQTSSRPVESAMIPAEITLSAPAAGAQASVFDPITNTRRPLSAATGGGFSVSVPNYPLLVWIRPAAATGD